MDQLWKIVEKVCGPKKVAQRTKEKRLLTALRDLSSAELIAYREAFWLTMHSAYTWEIYGLAYTVGGGCSDDRFVDFRASLIYLGKDRFNAVVKQPDSLADLQISESDLFYEGFQYPPQSIAEEFGVKLPLAPKFPDKHAGKKIDLEDLSLIQTLYPRIWQRYQEPYG